MKYIIYSHSDYEDILQIQSNNISCLSDTFLITNQIDSDSAICKRFKNYKTYDDSLEYPARVFDGINHLDDKYVVFMHDMDIVMDTDEKYLEKLIDLMDKKNIDRIDLKHNSEVHPASNSHYKITEDIYLCQTTLFTPYVYNVNPALWRLSALKDAMNVFRNENYRSIEHSNIQSYCSKKFCFYKIFTTNAVKAGYYKCTSNFKFLHLTHHGGFLPLQGNEEHLDDDIRKNYLNIVETYNLRQNRRPFRSQMW